VHLLSTNIKDVILKETDLVTIFPLPNFFSVKQTDQTFQRYWECINFRQINNNTSLKDKLISVVKKNNFKVKVNKFFFIYMYTYVHLQ